MKNKLKLQIIKSLNYDPWYNIALEEKLFYDVEDDEVILYLWQNQNTVVIGRNQNPWRECRYKELESDGGKLARRLSGGGAVFHDLGNMNFTFIAKKTHFNIEKQLQVIINAVAKLGIKAEFTGRNDILTDGKKFSGNAFYYEKDRCYHHGTLLVSADMSKLATYLKVSKAKIESKGIKSVKSRVINLKELNPEMTIDQLSQALGESFMSTYEGEATQQSINDESDPLIKTTYDKHASWEWRFGNTPKFKIELYKRFGFGDLEILINLKDSKIKDVEVYSDAMDASFILGFKKLLQGQNFESKHLLKVVDVLKVQYDESIIKEIQAWLIEVI